MSTETENLNITDIDNESDTINKKLTLGISACIFMAFLGITGIFALQGSSVPSICVYYLIISLVFSISFIFTIYQARLYCNNEFINSSRDPLSL